MITGKHIIKRYNGKVLPFKKLPKEYQMAMTHYMAIDGEAWEHPKEVCPGMRTLKGLKDGRNWMLKNISFWVKKYGNVKFGVMEIPTEEFTDLLFQAMVEGKQFEEGEFKSFKEYHAWYVNGPGGLNKATDLHYFESWPVILGSTIDKDFEILQDGWHRFHTYVRLKRKATPVIYYV